MKRNIEKAPGFDDVIFRDRNKEYGAYDLRRRYGSTMSVSIVSAMIFGVSLVLIPFFTTDREVSEPTRTVPYIGSIDTQLPDPPDFEPPTLPKRPERVLSQAIYSTPEIVKGTEVHGSEMPITEEAIENIPNLDPGIKWVNPGDFQSEIPTEVEPVVHAKEMPEFPGGETALMKYINENIIYPQDALDNGIEGKVVLQFVVSVTGNVTNVVVLRKADPMLDEEAVRVILSLPKWKPGKNDGTPVPVYFSVPVVFDIK